MNHKETTGLGEPEPMGKKALFRPPAKKQKTPDAKPKEGHKPKETGNQPKGSIRRVRMTMELSHQAFLVLENVQCSYRLQTGKSLPMWKAASQAIEFYGKSLKDEA